MNKYIGILICLCLVSCERLSAPTESQDNRHLTVRTDEYPVPDSLFHIQNQTHVNIGWVAIRLVDTTTAWINVPDSGTYSIRLTQIPAYCLINGYTLFYSNPEWIPINPHLGIHAGWTTNVVIVDRSEES